MDTEGGFLISRIHQLQARVFERMLRGSGVDAFNGPQGRILYVLWTHDTLSISEIGRLTSLAKSTLTSMLDRMEDAGLVTRATDKHNRRQILVSITDMARAWKERYDAVSQEMNTLFYQGFTEAEAMAFEQTLRRVLQNLEDEEGISDGR